MIHRNCNQNNTDLKVLIWVDTNVWVLFRAAFSRTQWPIHEWTNGMHSFLKRSKPNILSKPLCLQDEAPTAYIYQKELSGREDCVMYSGKAVTSWQICRRLCRYLLTYQNAATLLEGKSVQLPTTRWDKIKTTRRMCLYLLCSHTAPLCLSHSCNM